MKRSLALTCTILGSLFLVTGCRTSSAPLPSDDQALVWSGKRDKPFGTYETGKLATAKEAETVLEETFSVSVPSFFTESEKVMKDLEFLQSYTLGETAYRVESKENELTYERVSTYVTSEKRPVVRVTLQVVYQANPDTNQVKTTQQTLNVMTTPSEAPLFYEALPTLSEREAKFLHLSPKGSTLEQVIVAFPERDSERTLEAVTIVSSDKDQSPVQKNIQLFYDVNGYVTEWTAEVRYD